jgi:hypothetical protein
MTRRCLPLSRLDVAVDEKPQLDMVSNKIQKIECIISCYKIVLAKLCQITRICYILDLDILNDGFPAMNPSIQFV